MAYAITNGASVHIAPQPICAINPTPGATIGFWWRRLFQTATNITAIFEWRDTSSQWRVAALNNMFITDWNQPAYTLEAMTTTKSNVEVWQYFACHFQAVSGGMMDISMLISAPYHQATVTKLALTTPLYCVTDICFGKSSDFGIGNIEVCEISKFDRAISDHEFQQLAAGADPLMLGAGPAWHVSCGKMPGRDRGGLKVTSHDAIQTPQPAFLRR